VVCSSGVGFDPVLDGVRLAFGFEGIWQGTAVLYDKDTGSLWMHYTGTCFEGPRAGRSLAALSTGTHTTWATWRRDHPDTDVLAPERRLASLYYPRDAAKSGDPHLPAYFDATISRRDPRLAQSDLVLGARVGRETRAYPLTRLAKTSGVVEEALGGVPVTVWFDASSRTAVAFDARIERRERAFERRGDAFHERETGSRFDLEGRCVEGPLSGRRLVRVPALLSEWYGWFAHHPTTTVYEP
jgi:hypothetical protein